jgi:hypothetical protein
MPKVQNLFAATALVLIVLGLLASMAAPSSFDVLIGEKRGFGLSLQLPLFGMATLFGLFAFLYSIGYTLPFSPIMAKWHFWCSLLGVALLITGGAILRFAITNPNGPRPFGLNSIVFSVIAGLLTFLSVQVWFACDLARAVLSLRKS